MNDKVDIVRNKNLHIDYSQSAKMALWDGTLDEKRVLSLKKNNPKITQQTRDFRQHRNIIKDRKKNHFKTAVSKCPDQDKRKKIW